MTVARWIALAAVADARAAAEAPVPDDPTPPPAMDVAVERDPVTGGYRVSVVVDGEFRGVVVRA